MFWLILLIRAAVTATVVVSASVLAETVGPFWGGLIVSMPVAAGPAYVMLAMQQEPSFITAATLGSLAANAVTVVFMMAIVILAPRLRWPVALGCALLTWFISAAVVRLFAWDLVSVLLLNIAVFAVCLRLTRHATGQLAVRGKGIRRRWYDLPLRAAMVGALVTTVVSTSRLLGPTLTGMGAVFPVALTGLALLVMPRLGGAAAAGLFATAMRAMPGFAIAAVLLHLAAEPCGPWWGMLIAISGQLVFSAALAGWSHRSRTQANPRKA